MAKAGEQFVDVLAQAGDSFGVMIDARDKFRAWRGMSDALLCG